MSPREADPPQSTLPFLPFGAEMPFSPFSHFCPLCMAAAFEAPRVDPASVLCLLNPPPRVRCSAVRESDLCSHLSAQAIESCRWVVEPKIDGLAVRLTYRGRRLVQVTPPPPAPPARSPASPRPSPLQTPRFFPACPLPFSRPFSSPRPSPPQAATRGDGMVGEDVTHNASQIPGVPTAVESGPCGADGVRPVAKQLSASVSSFGRLCAF